jgi:hypothetical protein
MRVALLGWLSAMVVAASSAAAQRTSSDAAREAAYAVSVARIADSAIHRLEFFPARAQLRAQLLFLSSNDSTTAVFAELAKHSVASAQNVDEISARFERIDVPDDLHRLHGELVESLRAARSALDRLAASSTACEFDPTAVTRCQTPFASASSALSVAYRKYLDVRQRIAAQIVDTDTRLPTFVATRAP